MLLVGIDAHRMRLFRVVHAAVTDLDGVSVEHFSALVFLGKYLSIRARNLCPMWVADVTV